MAKHTPGPWKLHKTTTRGEFCWDYTIRSADDSAICTIAPVAQDANAALIAAAPDLFAIAKMLDHIASTVPFTREFHDSVVAARQVIEKVERGNDAQP